MGVQRRDAGVGALGGSGAGLFHSLPSGFQLLELSEEESSRTKRF